MRQTLRILGVGFLSLVSLETTIAIIDWFARWDWLKAFMIDHPHFATAIRTPFSYLFLLVLGYFFLFAERRLKQPRLIGRYANSRIAPDLSSATMQMVFDTENKVPGWDEHRFDWDWFIEAQTVNDSETPTTIDRVAIKVWIGKFWKKRFIEVKHLEDLDDFVMDMARNSEGKTHGKTYIGEHYQPVPSLMEKIRDIPLKQGIGHRGWLHLKVKQVNQREMNGGKIQIDLSLIDALQRPHEIHFKKKSDKDWDKNFYILKK
jgi:hypothetical protein